VPSVDPRKKYPPALRSIQLLMQSEEDVAASHTLANRPSPHARRKHDAHAPSGNQPVAPRSAAENAGVFRATA